MTSISPQENLQGIEDTPNPFHYPEYPHHGYYGSHAHHAQQNSPYFPAIYQSHYHHYHHAHHEALGAGVGVPTGGVGTLVPAGEYSPSSEASANEYFYGNSAGIPGGFQPNSTSPSSSFAFESSEPR